MSKPSSMLYGCAAVLLVACGGGGGGGDAAPPPVAGAEAVPAEASESTLKMAAWLTRISGEAADAKEPLVTDTFDPKRPDDVAPEVVAP